ncbi:MAG: helix-turn-helix transcriptional regulator [Clostridia bacterium]|nr:helix-turn-helix transcriptional regulator [Clostridia bacterium]
MHSQTTISHYEDSTLCYNHSIKHQLTKDSFYAHTHDSYELIFYKRGDITYMVNGRHYTLKRGDLVISRPSDIHCISCESPCDYERYCILFDEAILPGDVLGKLSPTVDVINFDQDSTVPKLFEKMDYYSEKLEGETLKTVLNNLIAEVMINVMLEAESASKCGYSQANQIISNAISYIDEHLLTLKGIEDICNELYITKSHLHHLFMKHLNISPKKYITSKRLSLAQREIAAGGKPTEVYLKCGFSDYSAFYRSYTAHFGQCPSKKNTSAHVMIKRRDLLKRAGE